LCCGLFAFEIDHRAALEDTEAELRVVGAGLLKLDMLDDLEFSL
jgi:hypothetical protein